MERLKLTDHSCSFSSGNEAPAICQESQLTFISNDAKFYLPWSLSITKERACSAVHSSELLQQSCLVCQLCHHDSVPVRHL